MGQYWYVVNLDKKEFVHPHKLGTGLKLWEQLANHPGTGAALIVLCAAMPEPRGGGDFDLDKNWHGPERKLPEHGCTPGPMPEDYPAIAKRTIGRWAGDRIALIGDYAEPGDIPNSPILADAAHACCVESKEEWPQALAYAKENRLTAYDEMRKAGPFTDISLDVCAVIEHELGGKYSGDGWREWTDTPKKATA